MKNLFQFLFIAPAFFTTIARAEIKVIDPPLDVRADVTTHVTLDLKDIPASDAFAAVCETAPIPTGVMITVPELRNRPVTLRLENVPWAEALVRVAGAAELSLSRWNGGCDYSANALQKAPNETAFAENWVYGPLDSTGPFTAVLQRVISTRSFDYQSRTVVPPSRRVQTELVLVPEPQIQLLEFVPWFGLTSARDADDQSIDPKTESVSFVPGSENIHAASVYLEPGAKFGKVIAALKLNRRLKHVSRYRRIEMDLEDLQGGANVITDSLELTIAPPRERGDAGVEFSVTIRPAEGKQLPMGADHLGRGTLVCMYDAANRVMRTLNMSNSVASDHTSAVIKRSFSPMWGNEDAKRDPTRIVLLVPLAAAEAKLIFNFNRVPLDSTAER